MTDHYATTWGILFCSFRKVTMFFCTLSSVLFTYSVQQHVRIVFNISRTQWLRPTAPCDITQNNVYNLFFSTWTSPPTGNWKWNRLTNTLFDGWFISYCKGCLSSNSPVPPFTTFPTTRQAEGDASWSCDPGNENKKVSTFYRKPNSLYRTAALTEQGVNSLQTLFMTVEFYLHHRETYLL